MNDWTICRGPYGAAIEQARILRDYLICESPASLDLRFLQAHVASLLEFADEAKREAAIAPASKANHADFLEPPQPFRKQDSPAA
jgi:hypothetical protein